MNNEDIGRTKLVKMDIDTGDSLSVNSRPYTLPLKHYEWVQREISPKVCLNGQAQLPGCIRQWIVQRQPTQLGSSDKGSFCYLYVH